MGNEINLVNKTYYQTFIPLNQHAVLTMKQLSNMLSTAADSTQIDELRFIQGEIYYLFEDYESSIFKWSKLEGTMSEWAKKNTGDAYVKLRKFHDAESMFKSVKPITRTINLEKLLALFFLYKQKGQQDLAIEAIKEAMKVDPDYQHLSRMANEYYEEIGIHQDAIMLSVSEYGRTKDHYWLQTIHRYIESGMSEKVEPVHFIPILPVLVTQEPSVFHHFIISLWDRYEQTSFYLDWLDAFHTWLFYQHETIPTNFIYEKLLDYMELAFLHLTNGSYLLSKDKEKLISQLLINSYRLLEKSNSYRHSICAAVVAWGEEIPGSIPKEMVESSRKQVLGKALSALKKDLLHLKSQMYQWADEKQFSVDSLIDWWVKYFEDKKNIHLLIAGTFSNGKTSFIHSLIGENILLASDLPTTSTLVHLHYGPDKEFHRLTEKDIQQFTKLEQLHSFTTIEHEQERNQDQGIIDIAWPTEFFTGKNITLIDSPGFNDIRNDENPTKKHISMADSILFVLSAEAPFRKTERDILMELLEGNPHLEVNFLLNKVDYMEEEEIEEVLEDVSRKIKKYFGNAALIPYSSVEPEYYSDDFGQFLQGRSSALLNSETVQLGRLRKTIPWFKKLLDSFEKEKEKAILRLNAKIMELQDQIKLLQSVYEEVYKTKEQMLYLLNREYDAIKDRLIRQLEEKVPQAIKGCSSLIQVNSDFKNLDLLLNDEINRELERLVRYDILPNFQIELEEWLNHCSKRFSDFTLQKEQIEQILTYIFEGVRLDFNLETVDRTVESQRVYQRRIINNFKFDPLAVLPEHNVKKALLMGAGRLLGRFNNTNSMLYEQYLKYFDTETFEEPKKEIQEMISLHFFDFHSPILKEVEKMVAELLGTLDHFILVIKQDLKEREVELDSFESTPELIDDPIQLFRILVRRQEILQDALDIREPN
jgi:hypothetical protein